jgi:hypothetical protein
VNAVSGEKLARKCSDRYRKHAMEDAYEGHRSSSTPSVRDKAVARVSSQHIASRLNTVASRSCFHGAIRSVGGCMMLCSYDER